MTKDSNSPQRLFPITRTFYVEVEVGVQFPKFVLDVALVHSTVCWLWLLQGWKTTGRGNMLRKCFMGDCVDVASVKVRTENWKKLKYSDRSFVPRSEVVRIVSIKI